jgi:hypothetical protein
MPAGSRTALAAAALVVLAALGISRASGALPSETLSVDNARPDSGSVTSVPAEISCGVHCSAEFAHGSAVTLIVTPREGDAFSGFHGDCSGAALRCTVIMDAAKTVRVNFFGFTLMRVKLNERRGTGWISFKVGARGGLTLAGGGVQGQSEAIPHASVYSLQIVPRGGGLRALRRTGRARVRFRAAFTPTGGAPARQLLTVVLRRRPGSGAAVSIPCEYLGAHGAEPVIRCPPRR